MIKSNIVRLICAVMPMAFLICVSSVFADRGMIRPNIEVNIEEPAQRAIIAHNGKEEMLILQTDIKADKTTKIVEFMPLPSKPQVSLAPEKCFSTLAEIVHRNGLKYYSTRQLMGRGKGVEEEAISIVVSAQLGPHDVTVVELKDIDGFLGWVRTFFQEHELGEPAYNNNLKSIVSGYLDRGLRFFAFDIITVDAEAKTVQPLTYIFSTDSLYYPLQVTNLYGGSGTIELFLIIPSKVAYTLYQLDIRPAKEDSALSGDTIKWDFLRSKGVLLPASDMVGLHEDLPTFMAGASGGQSPSYSLFAAKYRGPLVFDEDVAITIISSEDLSQEEEYKSNFHSGFVIKKSITNIKATSPETIIEKSGTPFTATQLLAVQSEDNVFLGDGMYHLFRIKNDGNTGITWTGFATGNAHVLLSYWNGEKFVVWQIFDAKHNRRYTLNGISHPIGEDYLYILVNCTGGEIFTDSLKYGALEEKE